MDSWINSSVCICIVWCKHVKSSVCLSGEHIQLFTSLHWTIGALSSVSRFHLQQSVIGLLESHYDRSRVDAGVVQSGQVHWWGAADVLRCLGGGRGGTTTTSDEEVADAKQGRSKGEMEKKWTGRGIWVSRRCRSPAKPTPSLFPSIPEPIEYRIGCQNVPGPLGPNGWRKGSLLEMP